MQGNSLSETTAAPESPGLLLECDEEGRILFLSSQARRRLGDAANLIERFGVEKPAELQRFLTVCTPGDSLVGSFSRGAQPAVPVRLTCVFRSATRLLLSAEVRERATDVLTAVNEQLFSLQSRVLENYFRLLRVQQTLDSRLQRNHRNPSRLLIEQLERERARLARDLHSGAGQSLSAIHVHVELIEKLAPELPEEIRRHLGMIGFLAREAGKEVRSVSHRLQPPEWQGLGVGEALRNLWNNSGIPDGFQGSLTIGPLTAEPPYRVRLAIYRAAQEGLSNAVSHAGASAIGLTLEERDGRLVLWLEDNGHGFDPTARPPSGGIGLRAIRDHVRSLGGKLQIASGPGGTKLEVLVPLHSSEE